MDNLKWIDENIHLLSRLLNDKKNKNEHEISKLYNELFVILEEKFHSILSNTIQYQDRNLVYERLQSIIEEMEIYITYPELLGKTLVGFVAFHTWGKLLSEIIDPSIIDMLKQNTSLPCIITFGKKYSIIANNTAEHNVTLTETEYYRICKNFHNKIDYSRILKNFIITSDKQIYPNLNFCWLPRFIEYMHNTFNKNIIKRLDAIVIYGEPKNSKEKNRWDFYTKFCEQHNIPIYIISNNQISLRQDSYRCQTINITQNEVYQQLNIPRQNYIFVDKLKSEFLLIKQFFQEELKEYTDGISLIRNDLVKILPGKTFNYLKEMQIELSKNKTSLEEKWSSIQKSYDLLQEKAITFEEHLKNLSSVEKYNICQPSMFVTWKRLFLQSIELNDLSTANEYIQLLKKYNNDEVYVCEVLLNDIKDIAPSNNDLNRIKWAIDTDFIRHAKMRLKKYLGFSDHDYMLIAKDLNSLHTPIESYYRALWEEENKNCHIANNLYKRALTQGCEKATEGFLRTSNNILSDLDTIILIPKVSYEVGKEFIEKKRFAKGITLLKIAATNKYLPAIKYLANNFYERINYYKENLSEEQIRKLDGGISIFNYIISQEPNNIEFQEKLGYLYKKKGDEQRALDIWSKCKTKQSLYECGRLYEYTDGNIPQDLDKAIDFFTQASKLGHQKANKELDKVTSWKQQNHTSYQSNKSYTSRVRVSHVHHDSGCFITTATCQALNKGDNCEELMLMRHFRDKMKETIPGIDILINEYYRIAPRIVNKIDKDILSNEIYQSLWKNELSKCYIMLQNNLYKEAIICYISMVMRLAKDYNEPFSDGIEDVIKEIYKKLNK